MSFICKYCNKVFKYKSKLKEHKNKKTSCIKVKKDNNCNICDVKFNYRSDLERHLKSIKHKNNYNIQITNTINETISIEKELQEVYDKKLAEEIKLKEDIQKEYNIKLANELKVKEDIISKLTKENNNLKYDFNDAIKSEIQNEVLKLVPIFDKITTYKGLNKIDMNEILIKYDKLLSITDLLYIINYNLNKLYIDKFWNNIESEDWIYLDEELIKWFGYKEITGGKEQIVKIIKREFEIDEDYKILNNSEFLISEPGSGFKQELKFNNNFKHIIMKPDCFKLTCMQVGTAKSKDIYKYFIEVEKIFKFYLKYTLEFKNYELEKSKLIKNRYINKSNLLINSKLYLITNHFKARENIFKFGSTINEKTRKSTYNTGHVEADEFFYVAIYDCYDAISLEKRIAKLLTNVKIPNESEMYQLHFNALDNIIKLAIKNDMNTVESINVFLISEYNKYLNLEPVKF